MNKSRASVGLSLLALVFLGACGPYDLSQYDYTAPDRDPKDRSPEDSACGDAEDIRCLLPWPSSSFEVKRSSTATGVGLSVIDASLGVPDSALSYLSADGFSRLTPVMVGFHAALDQASLGTVENSPVQLILAQYGHSRRGEKVPLRIQLTPGDDPDAETLLVAYPLRPLEPGLDYVIVVTDDLKAKGGAALPSTRYTQLALGRVKPASEKEAYFRGYHAPTRQLLSDIGIEADNVLRISDFTTRSADDGTHYLTEMRDASIAAVDNGQVQVVVDKVDVTPLPVLALTIEGRLTGLPSFAESNGDVAVDVDGKARQTGTREAPFRVVVPKGTGDYQFVLYGHGMGGNFTDESFDDLLGENGIGKVAIRFDGWTEKELITTFSTLVRMAEGSHRAAVKTMHAVAAAAAVQQAMNSILADVLAAPKINGMDNPAAGRRPDTSIPMWTGGSLGGTMGLLYVSLDPKMKYGVLNVPGAAWTHFIPGSQVYSTIRGLLGTTYGGSLDVLHALTMAQTNFDYIDGGAWTGHIPGDPSVLLVQESMGDPILPNEGTELLSVSTEALHIGKILTPIDGLETGTEAIERTALTQYKVPAGGDALDIHGFAARSGPAGDAARAQITAFIKSAWAGQAKITVPAGCPGGSCDFSK